MRRPVGRSGLLLAAAGVVAFALGGCFTVRDAVPSCRDSQRTAVIAQSVPTASQIPCLRTLPEGWRASGFDPSDRGTRFSLSSDRAPGRPVHVRLAGACDPAGATPTTPRAAGVTSFIRLTSIDPRYSGTLYDVFQGGCVTYAFDLERGPHIALVEGFEAAVGFVPRTQLRLDLRRQLHVRLDP